MRLKLDVSSSEVRFTLLEIFLISLFDSTVKWCFYIFLFFFWVDRIPASRLYFFLFASGDNSGGYIDLRGMTLKKRRFKDVLSCQ